MGIWPFIIPIIKASFKFHIRAKYSEQGSLLNMAFHAQNKLPNSSIYNLQSIANSLNFNLNVSDIGSPPTKESAVKLENATKLFYDNISREHIINSSKLGLLKRVLGDYKAPKYIFFIRNPCLRKALTRWRLSCHSLPIERGRHANIPKQERFCNQCNNRFLGDEVHALFMCNDNIIQSLRENFLTRIFQISHQLFYLDDKDRLYYFLQGHDRDVMPIVCEWFRKLDEIYVNT